MSFQLKGRRLCQIRGPQRYPSFQSPLESIMPTLPLTLAVITHNEAESSRAAWTACPSPPKSWWSTQAATTTPWRSHGRTVRGWCTRTGWVSVRNATSPRTQCSTTGSWCWMPTSTCSPALVAELEQRLPELMAGDAPAAWLRRSTIYMGADALVSACRWAKSWPGSITATARAGAMPGCTNRCASRARHRRSMPPSTTSTTPPCRTSSSRCCATPS